MVSVSATDAIDALLFKCMTEAWANLHHRGSLMLELFESFVRTTESNVAEPKVREIIGGLLSVEEERISVLPKSSQEIVYA